MKGTTKIVLGIVGALVIIVIALAIGARVVVDNILSSGGEGDAIELSGTYEGGIEVRRMADRGSYAVTVTDEALMEPEREGDALRVGATAERGAAAARGNRPAFPANVDGGADVRLCSARLARLPAGEAARRGAAARRARAPSAHEHSAVYVDGRAGEKAAFENIAYRVRDLLGADELPDGGCPAELLELLVGGVLVVETA